MNIGGEKCDGFKSYWERHHRPEPTSRRHRLFSRRGYSMEETEKFQSMEYLY